MGKAKGKKRKITKEKNPIKKPKTRKDFRKEKREMKKLKKHEYFSNRHGNVGRYVRAPEPEIEELPSKSTKIKNNTSKDSKENIIHQENIGAKKREQKLKTEMKEKRNNQLMKANEEEDKIIKKLEKQLKLKKRSGVAKSFMEDGLGYLLEVCDEETMSEAVAAEKHMADAESDSDFEEDFSIATGKVDSIMQKKEKKAKSSGNSKNGEDLSDFNTNQSTEELDEKEEEEDYNDESELEDSEDETCDDFEVEEFSDEDETEEGNISGHSGMCGFPNDSFQPGNLTPVREETEEELKSYTNNLQMPTNSKGKFLNSSSNESAISSCSDDGNIMELTSENEKMFDSESEDKDEDETAEMIEYEDSDEEIYGSLEESDMSGIMSDDSECEDDEFCSDEDNEHILVNGKVINTYGRPFPDAAEPEFERCPKLDKILANVSDSEPESQTTFNKGASVSDSKKNRKRKINKSEANDIPEKKTKKETKDKTFNTKVNNVEREISENYKQLKMKKQTKAQVKSETEESIDDSFDELVEEEEEAFLADVTDGKQKLDSDGHWEDIYGRKRDKDGNIVSETSGKYIPPHLRAKKESEDSAEITQLKRQIKGLLNKVAGSNMHWTSSQMETIYSSNSRNAVNNAFCSLWLSALVQSTATPDRMAAEHAMLVAALHANVGSEVGAYFLQTIVKKFDSMVDVKHQLENKEMDNLILAISQLYNFKIFQASLLYEILIRLLKNLNEKSIDCTLVALRNVGATLRKEDPAALKTFIHATQERTSNFKAETSEGSRLKFLLDVLMAIKNNNMNKIPNYDPSYVEELKKSLKGITRRGNYVVPLNIKLEDLLNAEEKGKWWVVGSAWEGSSKQDKNVIQSDEITKNTKDKSQAHLLELAKKQRINTELRRNIFCIIMSAEDYMDCFEKLQQLGLKNQQEKEIIHVLLSCLLQEKVYNPYYAVLAQKFCDYDRKFQLSIQFSIWDKLKEIDSCSTFQIANLAQFLTHLFNEKALPISILKVVQFSDLTKSALRLMRQILLAILLQKSWQTCLEVFQRVAISPKLHMFREGMRLFISHFLLKNFDKKEVLNEDQMALLKERASAIDKTLGCDSKVRF